MMQQQIWLFCTVLLLTLAASIDAQDVYLVGVDVPLTCMSNSTSDFVQLLWSDEFPENPVRIVTVASNGENEKSDDPKYANFIVDNTGFPASTQLTIRNIQLDDMLGPYTCSPSLGSKGTQIFEIQLEAPPESVTITCEPVGACPADTLDPAPSSLFTCSCTAIGAYPESLSLTWTEADESTPASPSDSSSRAGYYDITGEATFTPTEGSNTVTCVVGGYTNDIPEDDRRATYTFKPPVCSIAVDQTSKCTTVEILCECSGGNPGTGQYLFYDGTSYVAQPSNQWTAEITANKPYSFSCRGCNGVNSGTESGNNVTGTCVPSTTASPTTPTEPPTTPEEDSPKFAIIFGSIGGVVVLICLVAFLVWFFKYREGEDDPTATNPSRDGVQEPLNKEGSPKSKTKSAPPPDNTDPEIPAYGVVNKPKKTPEPAPRGNTMELQYADLDHGNAPPSNQIRMPEEPTEYATVQSVVV